MTFKIWLSALLLSFGIFLLLLFLSIPTIFLILLIIILALGSAVLTKVFISDSSEERTILERWLFVFVSSLFVFLIGILVEGDLAIIVPMMLIYGFGLFIFGSKSSFGVYTLLAFVTLGILFFWYGNEFITATALWGYLALFFSVLLFLFLYEHDYKVKNKAFHLLSDQLGMYQQRSGENASQDEMLIRTNKDLEITSVSQIAQKKLFSYQTSVIGKKLFTVLYIKDEQNVLIGNNNELMKDIVEKQEQITLENLTLILPNTARQFKSTLSIHPILTIEGKIDQIELCLKVPDLISKQDVQSPLESQKMSFQSLFTVLKEKLLQGSISEGIFTTELMKRGYHHLNLLEELGNNQHQNSSLVDSAQLLRTVITEETAFADLFKSKIVLKIVNKQAERENGLFPSTVLSDQKELTGPFYTISTDAQLLENLYKVIIYCLVTVIAFDSEKKINIGINSDEKNVRLTFSVHMSSRAQESFKKIFEGNGQLLNAGIIPYTLGIEGALLSLLFKKTGAKVALSSGSESTIVVSFTRYISKNISLTSAV